MTIQDAIDSTDRLVPNQYGNIVKTEWLSELDGLLYKEVFRTHRDCPVQSFAGYANANPDTELLVPFPYCGELYTAYLQSRIARANDEDIKYNQAMSVFSAALETFTAFWNREHMPIPKATRFSF